MLPSSMGMTQRVHRTLLLVFLLFIGAGIAVAVPLECYRQPPSEGDSIGDDGHDAASSSSSILCEFRMVENASGTTNPSGHHQYTLDKLCWRETNNENGPTATTTTCLSGAVHLTTTVDVEQVGEDDSFSSPSTDVHGNDNEQETEQKKDTLSSATASNQRTIVVGRAMYHEPYSQHGNRVAMVLDGAPSIDVDPNSQHWIDWYIELAAAHYPAAGQDPATDEVWVQIELTINAYEQAIQAIQRHELKSGSISFDNEVLLASVYYHLGESYSLDPEYRYVDQTVQALKSSHARFRQMLQLTSLHDAERMAIESKFAELCSKLGIALMSSLDPVDTIPAWARTMMTMAMDPMDSDNNFNHAQHPRQHPEYSESTTTLDIIQSYFQEAIQIFDRHLHVDDGGGEMFASSTDTLWSRLITPQDLKLQYAMALQQSATISSIQGHFSQAKQRYEQALKIQHDVLRVGGGAEGGHYLQDPTYAQTSIADLHLSLSDACVQLGDYPCARDQYARAMTTHIDHNVRVAPVMSLEMDAEVDDHIQDALEALQDYRTTVSGSGGGANRFRHRDGLDAPPYDRDGSGYFFGKDDGYEGGLLATLGTLYLSLGDPRSVTYLEHARELLAGLQQDRESPVMADVMFNLAMAYYRNYEFEKSKEAQWKALDLYQTLFGDGVNPYMQGLDEREELARTSGYQPAKIIDLDYFQEHMNSQNATKKEIMEEL